MVPLDPRLGEIGFRQGWASPSLTSNLPPAGSSQPGSTAEGTYDRIFADLDAGLTFALIVDDLALVSRSFRIRKLYSPRSF